MEMEEMVEGRNKKKPRYLINIKTWSRLKDLHGLYDYSQEQRKIVHKQYQLPINIPSFFILRNKKSKTAVSIAHQCIIKQKFPQTGCNSEKNTSLLEILAQISIDFNLQTKKISLSFACNQKIKQLYSKINQQKQCQRNFISISKDIPGIVVSQEKDKLGNPKGYMLKIGMIIFFGKVKYIVREIKKNKDTLMLNQDIKKIQQRLQRIVIQQDKGINQLEEHKSDVQTDLGDRNKIDQQLQDKKDGVEKQKVFCRVCYDTSSQAQDRLINPCECIGSCKYIHVKCLKNWLDKKVVTSTRQHCIITQKINCQICKAYLPMSINIDGFDEEVMLMQRPKECDYLMLQKLEINARNILIVKNPPNEGVSIGRGGSCYIKIVDNTISRKPHAFIQYKEGDFYVFDNQSKFGTLVLEEEFKMQVGKCSRAVQIGRSIVRFVVRKDQGILKEI